LRCRAAADLGVGHVLAGKNHQKRTHQQQQRKQALIVSAVTGNGNMEKGLIIIQSFGVAISLLV
jgi:hypothetical protein